MRGMNKFLRLLSDPKFRFSVLAAKGFYKTMPDEEVYKKSYQLSYGKKPDLKHPQGFNEKLMWLKLHDRKPLYTTLVDKYAVRRYIADKVGEEYLIPLLGGPWESADEIDFDALPNQFVLKCTHDSGSVIVCRDKSRFDIEDARRRLSRRLKRNYYYGNREWPYKDVPPRIIAEQYLSCASLRSEPPLSGASLDAQQLQSSLGLLDYKFMCFNGVVKALFLDIGVIDSQGKASSEYYRNIYMTVIFNCSPSGRRGPTIPSPSPCRRTTTPWFSLQSNSLRAFPTCGWICTTWTERSSLESLPFTTAAAFPTSSIPRNGTGSSAAGSNCRRSSKLPCPACKNQSPYS